MYISKKRNILFQYNYVFSSVTYHANVGFVVIYIYYHDTIINVCMRSNESHLLTLCCLKRGVRD